VTHSTTPHANRTPFALALVAVLLYAPLIGWGLPHATAPDRAKTYAADEILPLEPLAEMRSTLVKSQPDRNYGYPQWHYFVLAAAQAPYIGLLWLTGDLISPSGEYPFGLADPVRALKILTLIGRLVSVLMAAGIVMATYFVARTLWDRRTGIAAAVLTMLSYPMFYYSRTGNLDVPAFFWSSLGLAAFAQILQQGFTPRRAAWLGAFAGLAMATKDQSVVIFLPLGAMLLLPRFRRAPHPSDQWRSLAVAFGGSLFAYAIGTGIWIEPQRHLTHVHALLFDPQRLSVAHAYFEPHPRSWMGLGALSGEALKRAADAFSIPVLLGFSAGVARSARSAPLRLVLISPVLLLFGLLFVPTGFVLLRYYLPLTLIVDAFAAYGILWLRKTPLRPICVPALLVVCALRLLVGLDLSYAQLYETRIAAGRWIEAHVLPGERIEYFGPAQKLPPLPAVVESRRVAGRNDWRGQVGHGSAVLAYLSVDGPEYLLLVPDWTTPMGSDHSADCPPEVRLALAEGSVGYRQVAAFHTPALLPEGLRPPLDHPSVSPPVTIFARKDVAQRLGPVEGT
jgi:hypothetical protein